MKNAANHDQLEQVMNYQNNANGMYNLVSQQKNQSQQPQPMMLGFGGQPQGIRNYSYTSCTVQRCVGNLGLEWETL